MPALFAGVPMTNGKRPERIGQPETMRISPYGYTVRAVLAGHEAAWKGGKGEWTIEEYGPLGGTE